MKSNTGKIISANIISGLSLVCLIVFGVSYLKFKNTPIYDNYSIVITNNPITDEKNIEFAMTGRKVLDCQASKVYGLAINQDGTQEVILDRFVTTYRRNITPGENVTNSWSFQKPEELTTGYWRVDMIAHWTCRMWIFTQTETIRHHDNILLIVE